MGLKYWPSELLFRFCGDLLNAQPDILSPYFKTSKKGPIEYFDLIIKLKGSGGIQLTIVKILVDDVNFTRTTGMNFYLTTLSTYRLLLDGKQLATDAETEMLFDRIKNTFFI